MESWIDWEIAGRPMYLEDPSGDTHFVCVREDLALLAVLDGRGHGPEAAESSTKLVELIRESPWRPLDELLREGDVALAGGRGSAITLARLDRASCTLTWLSVGNVASAMLSPRAPPTRAALTPGCAVAFHLGDPVPQTISFVPGDLLVFGTDGIDPRFIDAVAHDASPGDLARSILANWRKKTDDALCLVARVLA